LISEGLVLLPCL